MAISLDEKLIVFAALTVLLIYVLPSIIAFKRGHSKRWAILLVNLIGGLFSGIGWIVAMVWCFYDNAGTQAADTTHTG